MSMISEAEDKIMKAKTKLVIRHPFFSVIALGLQFKNATEAFMDWVKTMATDGRHCFWDENFVNGLTIDECCGVIAHEVLHVVYQHPLRRGMRDPLIWNIAADYAINWVVLDAGLILPKDRLFDEKYKNWFVDRIYDDLIDSNSPKIGGCTMGQPSPQQGNSPQQSQQNSPSAKGKGNNNQPSGQGQAQGQPQPGQGNDTQELWGTVVEPKNDDGSDMSEADKNELSEEIKVKVLQAASAAKSIGKLPGGLEGLVRASSKPTVNWKEYIQSWVSGKVPDDYTWRKPNRKMLGLYNLITPSMELKGAGVGVLSIDNSGSVSNRELQMYVTEILGVIELCNPDKLYIIQHDSRVEKVDEWEQGDEFTGLVIKGRGGTCIKPVFNYVTTEIDEQIDWMVCFTDMEINDFPSAHNAPDIPVLWAATGPDCAPFGTYLPIRNTLDIQ